MFLIALCLLSSAISRDYVIIRNQCESPISLSFWMEDEFQLESMVRYGCNSGKRVIQPKQEEQIFTRSHAKNAEKLVIQFTIESNELGVNSTTQVIKQFNRKTDMGKMFEVSDSDRLKIEEAKPETILSSSKEKYDSALINLEGEFQLLEQRMEETKTNIKILQELSDSAILSSHHAELDSVIGNILKTEEAIFFVPQSINAKGVLKLKDERVQMNKRTIQVTLQNENDCTLKPRDFETYLSSIERTVQVSSLAGDTHYFLPGTTVGDAVSNLERIYPRALVTIVSDDGRTMMNYSDYLASSSQFVLADRPAPAFRDDEIAVGSSTDCNAPNACNCSECMCRMSYHC